MQQHFIMSGMEQIAYALITDHNLGMSTKSEMAVVTTLKLSTLLTLLILFTLLLLLSPQSDAQKLEFCNF